MNLDFLLGTGVGAVAGVVVERLVGLPIDRLTSLTHRNLRKHQRQRIAAKVAANKRLLDIGGELVYVHTFTPLGLEITTSWDSHVDMQSQKMFLLKNRTINRELIESIDVEEITRAIESKRQELQDSDTEWNEQKVGLSRAGFKNDIQQSIPVLSLAFHRSDYAASVVMEQLWRENTNPDYLHQQDDNFLYSPLSIYSQNFGVNATVLTDDGRILLVHRSARTSSERDRTHISVNEGVVPSDSKAGTIDPKYALKRGIEEELGVKDIDDASITFHSLILDATRYQWALLGHVDLSGTGIDEAKFRTARNSCAATDHWENDDIRFIEASWPSIRDALADKESWIAHGWLNLLYSGLLMFPHRKEEILQMLSER